jgi:hypothetical protein
MLTKNDLTKQMDLLMGGLPDRWKSTYEGSWEVEDEEEASTLEEWLLLVYSDHKADTDYSTEELDALPSVLRKLMRFEPSERLEADRVLQDPWFGGTDDK